MGFYEKVISTEKLLVSSVLLYGDDGRRRPVRKLRKKLINYWANASEKDLKSFAKKEHQYWLKGLKESRSYEKFLEEAREARDKAKEILKNRRRW